MTDKPSLAVEARERLVRQGFVMPDRPAHELPPVLPEDVTELPDTALMRLFSEFSAWLTYAHYRLSVAEVRERETEIALEQAKAMETVRGLGSDSRVTVAAKVGVISESVMACQNEQLEAYSIRKMTNTMVLAYERAINLLSREVTRRVSRDNEFTRAHKWGGA